MSRRRQTIQKMSLYTRKQKINFFSIKIQIVLVLLVHCCVFVKLKFTFFSLHNKLETLGGKKTLWKAENMCFFSVTLPDRDRARGEIPMENVENSKKLEISEFFLCYRFFYNDFFRERTHLNHQIVKLVNEASSVQDCCRHDLLNF